MMRFAKRDERYLNQAMHQVAEQWLPSLMDGVLAVHFSRQGDRITLKLWEDPQGQAFKEMTRASNGFVRCRLNGQPGGALNLLTDADTIRKIQWNWKFLHTVSNRLALLTLEEVGAQQYWSIPAGMCHNLFARLAVQHLERTGFRSILPSGEKTFTKEKYVPTANRLVRRYFMDSATMARHKALHGEHALMCAVGINNLVRNRSAMDRLEQTHPGYFQYWYLNLHCQTRRDLPVTTVPKASSAQIIREVEDALAMEPEHYGYLADIVLRFNQHGCPPEDEDKQARFHQGVAGLCRMLHDVESLTGLDLCSSISMSNQISAANAARSVLAEYPHHWRGLCEWIQGWLEYWTVWPDRPLHELQRYGIPQGTFQQEMRRLAEGGTPKAHQVHERIG